METYDIYLNTIGGVSGLARIHLNGCEYCQKRLGLMETDREDSTHVIIIKAMINQDFSRCESWLWIRKPLTLFEARLSEAHVDEMASNACPSASHLDYLGWKSYFIELHNNSMKLMR